MKKKGVTAVLALIFGVFGVHRFYLGERLKGAIHLIIFFLGLTATIASEGIPFVMVAGILGFIDAVLFFAMPKEEFDDKYNSKYLDRRRQPQPQVQQFSRSYSSRRRRSRVEVKPINSFKESGMRKYDEYQIEDAIIDFRKALNANFQDAQVHYLISCCYSINEEVEKSLFHLDKAVDLGFIDFDKIHSTEALAFLRTDNRFQAFVKNSYQIPRQGQPIEEPVEEPFERLEINEEEKENNLLDQIAELGRLYEKGVLTPEEFQRQKEKIISS